MKKLLFLLLICPAFCFSQVTNERSPGHQNELFEFSTSFRKSDTKDVQRYLDKKLDNESRTFTNVELDGTITLKSGMNFYIKLKPGELKLILDRKKNTEENYIKVKEVCEAIKNRVG